MCCTCRRRLTEGLIRLFFASVLSYEIMTTQHPQHSLTMQPVMWSHSGDVLRETDPAFRYQVFDELGEIAFITNTRASGQPASWQISRIINGRIGEDVADYPTAEDVMAALQKGY